MRTIALLLLATLSACSPAHANAAACVEVCAPDGVCAFIDTDNGDGTCICKTASGECPADAGGPP